MNRSWLLRVYGVPALLTVITFAGLLSALFGDGIWDLLSWIALTIPLLVFIWKYLQSRRRRATTTKVGKMLG